MPLLDELPIELESSLREVAGDDAAAGATTADAEGNGAFRLVFEADVDPEGAFGTQWLVVENGHVYVFAKANGKGPELRHDLPIESISEAKAEMLVGNGVLQAHQGAETVTLLRYTHATAAEANSVARQISALAKGEPPKAESIDHKKKLCPKCRRVLPEDTSVCPGCVNRRAVMVRLMRFLSPYKLQAALSVFIIVSIVGIEQLPPWIGGRIVDSVVTASRHGTTDLRPVIFFVMLFAASRLVAAGFMYGQRRLNSWLGARVLMDIRLAMFDKLSLLSLSYYDKRQTSSVMARITNDADHLWDFLADGIPWFIRTLLTLVFTGSILFRMDWQIALIVLTPGVGVFLLNRWFMPRARRRWRNVWHRISKMYAALGTTLTGMRVVKAFAQEDREVNRFRDRNLQVFHASYAANAMWAIYWPVLGLVMSLGSYIVWLLGGYKVLHGSMTVGTMTAFSGYLAGFYMPFQDFSRVIDWSTRSLTAADRVFEVLDTEPDMLDTSDAAALPEMKGEVEFDDVTFTYDGARHVLEDFTLKVEPGEMIGLVGHSGAGKSTIISLLARFYDVADGAIRIDGLDVRKIRGCDFRRQLGIVLQEPLLFPGSIRDNIAYAKPDATFEEIMRAAKAANCHEFVLKFPDGYDTQCGERGQRLSGGERQRISIARAILHDPKILILDEATASVDTETEKQIQEAIQRLVQNRTTFAIAHRLSTLRYASRLVVMKEGKMVECGSHDELMELDGVYANLVTIQTEVNRIRAV